MNHIKFLISKAKRHWRNHTPVPLDLFYEMLGAGIDVAAVEQDFHSNNQE